jgi:hypothetical protein
MAGKHGGARPGAGRPSSVDAQLLADFTSMSIRWARDQWTTLDNDQRCKILCAFAPKYIPQKVEQSGSLDITVETIKSDLSERLAHIGGLN